MLYEGKRCTVELKMATGNEGERRKVGTREQNKEKGISTGQEKRMAIRDQYMERKGSRLEQDDSEHTTRNREDTSTMADE